MPLTEQERRCLESVGSAFAEVSGRPWSIDETANLDDLFPNERTPEGIVTDGRKTVAVEVKRLTGDSIWNSYSQSLKSLRRSLAPPSGGHWVLIPCDDFRLPMDMKTRRIVKKEIAEQEGLRSGEKGVVRIPRSATVSLTRTDGDGHIWCCHTWTAQDELRTASERLVGSYFLVDEGQWEHSFVTEDGKQAFVDAMVEACTRRAAGELTEAQWTEEWELLRADDLDPGQVDVLCVTEARSVPGANAEAVDLVLDDALSKFEQRKWGDLHAVVLDREGPGLTVDYLVAAIRSYPFDLFEAVDLIVVIDENAFELAWSSSRYQEFAAS